MEKKIYDYVIFDVYNVAWRWTKKAEKENTTESEKHTEVIEGFFKAFETYKHKFGGINTKYYLLFDNASTLWERKDISSEYKKNRKENRPPNFFFKSIDYIETIVSCYEDNITYYRVPQWEADDYVPNLIPTFKEGSKVLLISTDLDWSRCLSNSNIVVEQYTNSNKEIYTVDSFTKEFGFKPTYSNVCFYKSFYGDYSDCIKAVVPELPLSYFKAIAYNCKNMNHFFERLNNNEFKFDAGWKMRFNRDFESLLDNWKLVSAPYMNKELLNGHKHVSKYNALKLQTIYNTIGLTFDKRFNYGVTTSVFDMFDGMDIDRASVKDYKKKDIFDDLM